MNFGAKIQTEKENLATWATVNLRTMQLLGNSTVTGKYLSEVLILASTNRQYDDKLYIELRVQFMKITSSGHDENMLRTC